MKKRMRVLLMALVMLITMTNAFAVRMENNGDNWFLSDGRIVQTKRVLTATGKEYPGLMCYDQQGELLWEHTFRVPAVGRSDCRLMDEGIIAFMYHDQNHQYFTEFFHPDGNLIAKNTREPYTTGGIMFEEGAVFCVENPHYQGAALSLRRWDGSEKYWEFQGTEKITLYSVQAHGNAVYVDLHLQSKGESVHSILCIDAEGNVIRWAYRLDSVLPVRYTGNELGGITLFVQKDAPDDQYELEMLTLDAHGNEALRSCVDGIPPTMALNVISEQNNGIYTIWGYGYDTYGDDRIIYARINPEGKTVERKDTSADYATCVRYLNNQIYVMNYENGIGSFQLIPFDEFSNH